MCLNNIIMVEIVDGVRLALSIGEMPINELVNLRDVASGAQTCRPKLRQCILRRLCLVNLCACPWGKSGTLQPVPDAGESDAEIIPRSARPCAVPDDNSSRYSIPKRTQKL